MNPVKRLLIFKTILVLVMLSITWSPVQAAPAPAVTPAPGLYEGTIQFDANGQFDNRADDVWFKRYNEDQGEIYIQVNQSGQISSFKAMVNLGSIHGYYLLKKHIMGMDGSSCDQDIYVDGDLNTTLSPGWSPNFPIEVPIVFKKDTIYSANATDTCPDGNSFIDESSGIIQLLGDKSWFLDLIILLPNYYDPKTLSMKGDCNFPAWTSAVTDDPNTYSMECSWSAYKKVTKSPGWKK